MVDISKRQLLTLSKEEIEALIGIEKVQTTIIEKPLIKKGGFKRLKFLIIMMKF